MDDETRGRNPNDEHLPGTVSDQNAEEQPTEHDGSGQSDRPPAKRQDEDGSDGGAGEGSQSTGSPTSAG